MVGCWVVSGMFSLFFQMFGSAQGFVDGNRCKTRHTHEWLFKLWSRFNYNTAPNI